MRSKSAAVTSPTIPAMPSPTRGLYEELITEALEANLLEVGDRLRTRRRSLPQAEAADRMAQGQASPA